MSDQQGATTNSQYTVSPPVIELIAKGVAAARLADEPDGQRTAHLVEAARWFDLACDKAKEISDPVGMPAAQVYRARVHLDMNEPSEAFRLFQQAEANFSKLGSERGQARALIGWGAAAAQTGRTIEAVSKLQAGITLAEKYANDIDLEVYIDFGKRALGMAYVELGRYKDAESLMRALPITPRNAGTRLTVLGRVAYHLGQYDLARRTFEEARKAFQMNNDFRGEAQALLDTGYLFERHGELSNALLCHKEATQLYQKAGEKSGEGFALIGTGNVFLAVGSARLAQSCYERAIMLLPERHGKAQAVANTALALAEQGKFGPAMARADEAELLFADSVEREIGIKRLKAHLFLRQGKPENALPLLTQLLESLPDEPGKADPSLRVHLLSQKAEICMALGRSKEGERTLGEAQSWTTGSVLDTVLVKSLQARLSQQRGDRRGAQRSFAEAIGHLEGLWYGLGALHALKDRKMNAYLNCYTGYIALLAEEKKWVEAFDMTQKAKARALLNRMATVLNEKTFASTDAEREEEERLSFDLNKAVKQYLDSVSYNDVSKEGTPSLRAAIAAMEEAARAYTDFQTRAAAAHPDPGMGGGTPARYADISKILPPRTLLFEMIALRQGLEERGDDPILEFVIWNDGKNTRLVNCRKLGMQRGQLQAECTKLSNSIRTNGSVAWQAAASRIASDLFDADIRALLNHAQHVIMCPDGPLRNIPVHVLPVRGSGDIFERSLWGVCSVSYGLSASAVKVAREITTNRQRKTPSKSLVAYAYPVEDVPKNSIDIYSALEVETSNDSDHSRPLTNGTSVADVLRTRLKYARKEVNDIVDIMPGSISRVGQQAKKELFEREVPDYRFVHCATHGYFCPDAPQMSVLTLAGNESRPGYLTALELSRIKLTADMVVLSGCSTGIAAVSRSGRNDMEVGIDGFTATLACSGVPTQVVSLWEVDDLSTSELMVEMYRRICVEQQPATALREAAKLISRRYRHPYFWGPFVCSGVW